MQHLRSKKVTIKVQINLFFAHYSYKNFMRFFFKTFIRDLWAFLALQVSENIYIVKIISFMFAEQK